MANRLDLKAKRHLDNYIAEKHTSKRERKEDDLRLAEEQIAKLKEYLRQLEDIIDGAAKRPMPPREEEDSPEMHVNKRGRTHRRAASFGSCTRQQWLSRLQGEAVLYHASPFQWSPSLEESPSHTHKFIRLYSVKRSSIKLVRSERNGFKCSSIRLNSIKRSSIRLTCIRQA